MFLDTLEHSAGQMAERGSLPWQGTAQPHIQSLIAVCVPSSCTRVNATSSVLPGLLLAGKQLWKAAGHLPIAHARASGLPGARPAAQRP